MSSKTIIFPLTTLAGLLLPLIVVAEDSVPVLNAAAATPPTAFLERAEIIGIGNKIHVLRVPTPNVNGKTKYFDLEIDLTVNDKGKIGDTAAVIVAKPLPS
jgi:hypothetical protein